MKEEDKLRALIEQKIELLQAEVGETKMYIEVIVVTLVFTIIGYFVHTITTGREVFSTPLGIVMVVVVMVLFTSFVYFTFHILGTLKQKQKELVHQKRSLIRNWLE